jgi:hypothetical protein
MGEMAKLLKRIKAKRKLAETTKEVKTIQTLFGFRLCPRRGSARAGIGS